MRARLAQLEDEKKKMEEHTVSHKISAWHKLPVAANFYAEIKTYIAN